MNYGSMSMEGKKVDFTPDLDLKIVSREKWIALAPVSKEPLPLPAQRVFFMFTDTERCHSKTECIQSVQGIQRHYMERGMPDLPFSFLVGGDLRIYEGRGWGVKISRNDIDNWNDERVVIAYICPQKLADDRTDNMIRKAYQLMYHGIDNRYLVNFDKHDVAPPNLEDETELLNKYNEQKAMKEEEERKKHERREMRRKAREEAAKTANGGGDKEHTTNIEDDTTSGDKTAKKDEVQKEEYKREENGGKNESQTSAETEINT